jgi:AcrR family transcriptional regulator
VSEQEWNVPVVWSRRFRGGRPDQPALSREQIVQTARKLLDEEGLERLSMRRLGARLKSGATSIYWYVVNKDELLDLVMDGVLAEVPVPEPTGDWCADLRALIRGFREITLAHPWILPLYGSRPALGPHALRYAEAQLSLLSSAGFADDELDGAYNMISDYVKGSLGSDRPSRVPADDKSAARTDRTAGGAAGGGAGGTPGPAGDAIDWAALESYLSDVSTPYPALRGYREHLLRHDRDCLSQQRFDFGLDVLLHGLAARLTGLTSA